jgi:5-enolpyruvylshikimate-3-phosphate synthase
MPKFVIERDIPEAGRLSSEQLQATSRKSCEVLREMGAQIQWVQSYVTDDKIHCIYVDPDEDAVLKHARQGVFRPTELREFGR